MSEWEKDGEITVTRMVDGEVNLSAPDLCKQCAGTGKRPADSVDGFGLHHKAGERCPYCQGAGRRYTVHKIDPVEDLRAEVAELRELASAQAHEINTLRNVIANMKEELAEYQYRYRNLEKSLTRND